METIKAMAENTVFMKYVIYGVAGFCALLIIICSYWGIDRRERDIRTGPLAMIAVVICTFVGFLLITAQLTRNNESYWQPILKNIQQTCRLQWDGGVIDAKNGQMTINGFLGNPVMIVPLSGEIKFERNGTIYVLDVEKCRVTE
ncbi:MAG: hypothetical protein AAB766_03855 [Patescibacteria group bacterium]